MGGQTTFFAVPGVSTPEAVVTSVVSVPVAYAVPPKQSTTQLHNNYISTTVFHFNYRPPPYKPFSQHQKPSRFKTLIGTISS